MIDLKLENGDLQLNTLNSFETIEDKEVMSQEIKDITSTNLKEWFLDEQKGIDMKSIFTKNYDEETIRLAFVDCLSQYPMFKELLDFNMEVENRVLTVNIKLLLIDDEITQETIVMNGGV